MSNASARLCPWKFPAETTSSGSSKTIGLSVTAFRSISTSRGKNASASRAAPWTCGHAAQRVGVLDVSLARPEPLGARRQRSDDGCRPGLPGQRAERVDALVERGRLAAETPRARARRAASARVEQGAAHRNASSEPMAAMKWVPLTSASASFGASSIGSSPAARKCFGRRDTLAVRVDDLAFADEGEEGVSRRREVAAGSERAGARDDRGQARVQQLGAALDHEPGGCPSARAAGRSAGRRARRARSPSAAALRRRPRGCGARRAEPRRLRRS